MVEVAYPVRSDRVAHGFRRWTILDRLQRALLALDFHVLSHGQPQGGGEWSCTLYREHFSDERRFVTHGSSGGQVEHTRLDHGVHAFLHVTDDLRTAILVMSDDRSAAVAATDPSGLCGLVQAFNDELEFQARGPGRGSTSDFLQFDLRSRFLFGESCVGWPEYLPCR